MYMMKNVLTQMKQSGKDFFSGKDFSFTGSPLCGFMSVTWAHKSLFYFSSEVVYFHNSCGWQQRMRYPDF